MIFFNKRIFIIITLVITLFIIGCSNTSKVSIEENEIYDYLVENKSVINIDNSNEYLDLAIIDDDLKNNEIFFTGENHGLKTNIKLRMKFLKYFKEKTDFKYYLCELSYSDSYFLNKFLESGDIKIIEKMYKPLKGTFAWNKDSYNHWKELYEYNNTLPEDKKIKVVGVDIEHQLENAFWYMNSVLPAKESPKEIEDFINELKLIEKEEKIINEDEIKAFSKNFKKDIAKNENIYKEYLGENFFGFKLVNDNILYRFEAYNSKHFNKIRDKRIYENFKKVYESFPKGKYYGQWGLNHVFQKEQDNTKWLGAAMNNEDSVLKDKVLSIVYVYNNCKFMNRDNKGNGTYFISDMNSSNENADILNDISENDVTIFKLNNKNSPFSKELIWPFIYRSPKNGVTTDYFQYIIMIKNSGPTEPLNDEYN